MNREPVDAGEAPVARKYRLPRIAATIDRRVLVSYRLDPEVAQSLLPGPLRPHLVDGSAVAGFCVMRLAAVRPAFFGGVRLGWRGESAAHRIAVQWNERDDAGRAVVRSGVYVPVRHSAARFPTLIGGRVFPGVQHRASFTLNETAERVQVGFTAPDVRGRVDVEAATGWSSSLFGTLEEASEFNRLGNVAWSPGRRPGSLDCLSLHTTAWEVSPARLLGAESSFFSALPEGSAEYDSSLIMRGVPMTWGASA
ncbi:hypothetical protein VD659_15215 [Herbiconiux sp. 11R-BC]|uniref:hypothetical protein n=1 Tax=Herbiconiux sp. 11R-BC TaxID=3111637 RepID=UPI003C0B31EA